MKNGKWYPTWFLPREGSGHLNKARQLQCVLVLTCVVPTGLVWRLAPLHLPAFAFKYGGSALWAVAVYWLVAACVPEGSSFRIATLAAGLATAVELLKLVYWGPLDRFRETMAGKLLLGRYFTMGALLAYWTAIAIAGVLDQRLFRTAGPQREPDAIV